jgi:O-antigen/teichoic acid export membrane protein
MEDGLHVSDRWRIVRGTMQSFLIQGGSVALVFASNLLLVRASDPGSYGLYVHVFNWVSILAVVALGGRDDLVLAQIPRYRGGRPGRLLGLVRATNRWVLGAALVAGLCFGAVLFWVRIETLSDHQTLFRLGMIAVYLTAALTLNQLVLQALDHIRLSQVVEKLVKPMLLILGIGLLRWLDLPVDARTLVILACVVLGICCGCVGLLVYGKTRFDRVGGAAAPEKGVLSAKTTYFFLISLFYLLSTKITMLILPVFLPAKDIGIFNIGYRFADLLIFPFFLMHTVLPQLFARHTDAEKAYTQSLYSESNKLMSVLSLPLLLLILVAGHPLLRWFGPEFTAAYPAMLYISLAQFLFALFGPANTILMMQDKEKYAAACLLGYVLVLAGTSWWLVPAAGISGGAMAILISSAGYNIVLAVVVYKVCGIRSPFLAWLWPRTN